VVLVVGVGDGGEAEEEVGEGADDVLVRWPVVEREVAEQQLSTMHTGRFLGTNANSEFFAIIGK